MFARKIQLNWEFVPALPRVTTSSFVTPTLLQPCTTHTLRHCQARGRQLVPYPLQLHPPATPCVSSPFLPAYTSCSLILPSSRKAEERRKQQTRGKGKGQGGQSIAGYRPYIYTYIQEIKLKIQLRRSQSLVTVWHSGNPWWATGESRFPQHLYSHLRSRWKWKIKANGCTCTKVGGVLSCLTPWWCGSSAKGVTETGLCPSGVCATAQCLRVSS